MQKLSRSPSSEVLGRRPRGNNKHAAVLNYKREVNWDINKAIFDSIIELSTAQTFISSVL